MSGSSRLAISASTTPGSTPRLVHVGFHVHHPLAIEPMNDADLTRSRASPTTSNGTLPRPGISIHMERRDSSEARSPAGKRTYTRTSLRPRCTRWISAPKNAWRTWLASSTWPRPRASPSGRPDIELRPPASKLSPDIKYAVVGQQRSFQLTGGPAQRGEVVARQLDIDHRPEGRHWR